MNQANLATLERVDVRCAWPHEAQDFTPWLANNLGPFWLLQLGLVESGTGGRRKKSVSLYRILGRTSWRASPRMALKVLIENQLE